MVISIEISHSGKSGRHPHINILAGSDNKIPVEYGRYSNSKCGTNQILLNEWKEITNGTSFIHSIRPIEVSKAHFATS